MSRSDDVKFCKAFWSLAENTIAHVSKLKLACKYSEDNTRSSMLDLNNYVVM